MSLTTSALMLPTSLTAAYPGLATPPPSTPSGSLPRRPRRRTRTILVAIDGSPDSLDALRHTIQTQLPSVGAATTSTHLLLASVATFPGTWSAFLSTAFHGATQNRDKAEALHHEAEEWVLGSLVEAGRIVEAELAKSVAAAVTAAANGPQQQQQAQPGSPKGGGGSGPAPRVSWEMVPVVEGTGGAHPRHALRRLCRERMVDLAVVGAFGMGREAVRKMTACSGPGGGSGFSQLRGGDDGLGSDEDEAMGTTASYLVRFAGCPVLVHRPARWGGVDDDVASLGMVPEEEE
ncbi:hypothetical protein DFJ73DRAFT_857498 [Zopfochytrium polystomum]|nr:hypothetical protein DFJ73DRAFT_857498 [Zopfochytrium polystomum]